MICTWVRQDGDTVAEVCCWVKAPADGWWRVNVRRGGRVPVVGATLQEISDPEPLATRPGFTIQFGEVVWRSSGGKRRYLKTVMRGGVSDG